MGLTAYDHLVSVFLQLDFLVRHTSKERSGTRHRTSLVNWTIFVTWLPKFEATIFLALTVLWVLLFGLEIVKVEKNAG